VDQALADAVLLIHLAFMVWVMFGALVTRARAWLAALHILSVVYGIVAELGPWPCPLTLAENFFEARAGLVPYQGPFVLHYLDAIVYPNLPAALIVTSGVLVCFINLLVYVSRLNRYLAERKGY
jgi:Protein of Unknown function (DUF2784)